MALKNRELEEALAQEKRLDMSQLRDENPLDLSAEFAALIRATRNGNVKECQEIVNKGVNINGRDKYDYTPLILASLCGHYEVAHFLLEAGALAERNTFQGERCLYNALNERIRTLLLEYDFSKSTDPYVYWSSHLSSLLDGKMSDIALSAGPHEFNLHKLVLASRTPYFARELAARPAASAWDLAPDISPGAFRVALRYVYAGDLPRDLAPPGSGLDEDEVLAGLRRVGRQLEMEQLQEAIAVGDDRKLARQRHDAEVARAISQFGEFFTRNILGGKMVVEPDRVDEVKWDHDNPIFADILLRAGEATKAEEDTMMDWEHVEDGDEGDNIPDEPTASASVSGANGNNGTDAVAREDSAVLYPAHKAMLLRSGYFRRMFSNDFVEAQKSAHLRIVTVDCTPEVLEVVLRFLYTEDTSRITLDHALDVLYAADMLFLDALKAKAALAISTLGSAPPTVIENGSLLEPVNIYDVIHAGWDLRVRRLEEFAAKYLADRLEHYVEDDEFADLIAESARRLKKREKTDSIELLDDIRSYLDERFRRRFQDLGLGAGIGLVVNDDARIASMAAADAAAGDTAGGAALLAQGQQPKADVAEDPHKSQKEALKKAEDEKDAFAADELNYKILQDKIEIMLSKLKLDA